MTLNEQMNCNKNFLAEISSEDKGIRKQAAADFDTWLVTYQRQDGVWRTRQTPTPVTEADFAEAVDIRDPFIIRAIKPRSAGAISTNFDTGTMATGMYANKYTIFLHRAWTPKYRIDRIYLTSYKGDLLDIFKDLSLQDLLAVEDVEGMSMLNACIGAKSTINPDIGIKQYIDGGALTVDNIAHAIKGLTLSTDNINPSNGLVHRSLWWDIVTQLKADQYGDAIAAKALVGDMAVLEESLYGIKFVSVLESRLVPSGTMYITAEPKYCGDFVTYGEAKTFTKVEDDIWFEMWAHETYGMSMPYRGCATRTDFGTAAREEWK